MPIEDVRGAIDYEESGAGPTLVFIPGSFATPAAWKPILRSLEGPYRIILTSLLGYGGTAERRTSQDTSIAHEVEVLAAVCAKAAVPVHVVGHSYGGLCAFALALSGRAPIASMTLFEPNPIDVLRHGGEAGLVAEVRDFIRDYAAGHAAGDRLAARRVIDFYGGPGAFDALPERARSHIVATTATNLVDWQTASDFVAPLTAYAGLDIPTTIVCGAAAHPVVRRIDEILAETMPCARLEIMAGAGHFMITTHPAESARVIARRVDDVSAKS
jgi:pimeloyl-ACP methyl ester carboxylesterase